MKNVILLAMGAIVTTLFLLLPSQAFELAYSSTEFSNEMYNEGLYTTTAIITVALAWGTAALFYYVINSVSFSRWWHWLIMLCASAVVAAVANYVHLYNVFTEAGYDYSTQLFSFCLVDCLYTAALYAIASFSIRWWSSNCRHTPFPE